MTQLAEPRSSALTRPAARRGIGVFLILSLLATCGMQTWVRRYRDAIVYPTGQRPLVGSRLAGMDSFAVGLILGGLRGPLVMVLWTSSETQKSERNLEDIGTKLELIRMLQPEFDSVLIYQIWNMAYNLSAQMSSPPNKYATILDAIDYGLSADRDRPDNLNILSSIADVYFEKLGNSAERNYYIARMRQETKAGAGESGRERRGWRRTRHDPMLDERGFILPALLEPRAQLRGTSIERKGYNGAALQYLARYNTPEMGGFPTGLTPQALGYNYFRRAMALQAATGQKHAQMSDYVIESRPAHALKRWAELEWALGRQAELNALGLPVGNDHVANLPAATQVRPDAKLIADRAAAAKFIEEAMFSYRRSVQVNEHAVEEYSRQLKNMVYTGVVASAMGHIEECQARAAMAKADRQYLGIIALTAGQDVPGLSRQQLPALRNSAAESYQRAIDRYYLYCAKHALNADGLVEGLPRITTALTGKPVAREELGQLKPELYQKIVVGLKAYYRSLKTPYPPNELAQIEELEQFIQLAQQRLAFLAPPAPQGP